MGEIGEDPIRRREPPDGTDPGRPGKRWAGAWAAFPIAAAAGIGALSLGPLGVGSVLAMGVLGGLGLVLGGVTAAGLLDVLPEGKTRLGRGLRWLWEGDARARLEEAREASRVELLPPDEEAGTLSPEARCKFCGSPFEGEPVVRCLACDTPHHEDCWNQGGRCSIYGCGETRARRVETEEDR